MRAVAFASVILLSLVVQSIYPLNILSFNIKNFGMTKYSKQYVIDVLIDIVERYDLILIMELVDVSQTVLPGFMEQLNNHVENKSIQFNYTVSDRLGRSNNKEQYVFAYRTDAVEIIDTFQYPDENDYFERPPYSVLIHSIKPQSGTIPPFFIIASHIKPKDAVNELNNLTHVFQEAQAAFSTNLGLIMGDLNADCTYVSNAKYAALDLIVDTNFTWWIDKLADTTTSSTDCAYDRIISRVSLDSFVVNNSVQIFLFDNFFNLSSDLTSDVSDHYPVEISLQGLSVATTESTSTLSPSSTDQGNDNTRTHSGTSTSTVVSYSDIFTTQSSSAILTTPISTTSTIIRNTNEPTERGAANTLNSNGVLLCLALMIGVSILFTQL